MIGMIILGCTCIAIILTFIRYDDTREKGFEKEREQWIEERKDLLDRIQAPTFAEYTNKVIKEIKAEQPPDIKQVDDYIS